MDFSFSFVQRGIAQSDQEFIPSRFLLHMIFVNYTLFRSLNSITRIKKRHMTQKIDRNALENGSLDVFFKQQADHESWLQTEKKKKTSQTWIRGISSPPKYSMKPWALTAVRTAHSTSEGHTSVCCWCRGGCGWGRQQRWYWKRTENSWLSCAGEKVHHTEQDCPE